MNDKKKDFVNLIDFIKKNGTDIDLILLRKAYMLLEKDGSEIEKSNKVERCISCINFNLDSITIISSLVNFDTYEDGFIAEEFGHIFVNIKRGMKNVDNILSVCENVDKQDFDALKKYLIASCRDIRVLILKIIDKYTLLKEGNFDNEDLKKDFAKKIFNIYSPISEYLGLNVIKSEIDNLSFSIINPEIYERILEVIDKDYKEDNLYSDKLTKYIKDKIDINIDIFGRRKNIYSIYNKIIKIYGYYSDEFIFTLNDLWAFTILVSNIELCYKVLGQIHTIFTYIPEEFDDYISRPKSNGFRALQTTVKALDNKLVEIQIKTYEMHEYNEFGPASHISYKSGNSKDQFDWVKNLSFSGGKDISGLKLFEDKIFVFTPMYMVKQLKKGSTPVDFAYSIHTQIGNSIKGAKVNGKMVPLIYQLSSGDIVEIIKDKNSNIPKKSWEQIAQNPGIKRKIRKFSKEKDKVDIEKNKKEKDKKIQNTNISKDPTIENNIIFDNITIKLSKCCNPKKGDSIVGRVGVGGVIKIHKKDCSMVLRSNKGILNFSWK